MDQKDLDVLVSVVSSNFSIESIADRYIIHGVPYNGEVCRVNLSKALLDNGASHPQTDWIKMTRQGEWKLPSGPLYFAVLAALYDNKDSDKVGEVKKMLANDFKDYFMMTSTCIRYAREGLDTVVHDFGYASERAEKANIVGVEGCISEASNFGAEMQALIGINDAQKVQRIGNWITGKNPYFWCVKSKPKETIELALVLGDYGDRFYFYANDDNYGRARGMVAHVAKNSP